MASSLTATAGHRGLPAGFLNASNCRDHLQMGFLHRANLRKASNRDRESVR
ncbi:MAG: hypothetical protein JWR21_2733 [Herminiimonas sp.]|jgi:hypothetical protein|nr:hypothetical protein [Herminiimonas sp.]